MSKRRHSPRQTFAPRCHRPTSAPMAGLGILSFFLVLSIAAPGLGQDSIAEPRQPTKSALIKTLQTILPLLESGQWENAAQHVTMPPQLKPQDLASLVRNRELSVAGIQILQQDAKFGTAVERFGPQRAKHFCDKMSVTVEDVYGFNHRVGDQYGEVLAKWDGEKFKLIRVDDVGKLQTNLPSDPPSTPLNEGTPKEEKQPPTKPEPAKPDPLAAIPGLRSTVEGNPDDVAARANYAMALYQIGNYPEAWKQLIAAKKLQPNHYGVTRGIDVLIDKFSKENVFMVGVPSETIEGILGPPQQTVEKGKQRKRWVYGHWGIDFRDNRVHEIINLLGATEALFLPTEVISVDLDGRAWQTRYRRKVKNRVSAFLYVAGELPSDFSEQISIERMLGASAVGPIESIAKKAAQDERASHPGSQCKILLIEGDSAYLAAQQKLPDSELSVHRLIRLTRAEKDVHRLQYAIKSKEAPDQDVQAKWLKRFQAAKLKKTSSP